MDVILVDESDYEIGTEEKLQAHKLGLLHRAFSILIFDSKGRLFLQQRAMHKYHCGGLWTNIVCSHPKPGEGYEKGAHRRLQEEMGFDCPLQEVFHLIYKAEFENGLTEHEFDRVFIGFYEGDIHPDPEEIMDIKWVEVLALKADMKKNPGKYTEWFKLIINDHFDKIAPFLKTNPLKHR